MPGSSKNMSELAPVALPDRCVECSARAAHADDSSALPAPIDRREFVARSALAAAGALLASACGGGSNATGPGGNTGGNVGGNTGGSGGLSVRVSSFPALANVGGVARVDSGQGTPVAAVRTGATAFAAFSLICPHFGCTVGINASTSFLCPCHGARFASNGKWTGGQSTGNLTALTVSYDATTDLLTITG
jgi:Rieske Fe-S protein